MKHISEIILVLIISLVYSERKYTRKDYIKKQNKQKAI
jgi:hypothetical protein